MPRARKTAASKPASDGIVKVGDVIELEPAGEDGMPGNGLAELPDGTVVTVRQRYTIAHEGLHIIDGVEYLAEKSEH